MPRSSLLDILTGYTSTESATQAASPYVARYAYPILPSSSTILGINMNDSEQACPISITNVRVEGEYVLFQFRKAPRVERGDSGVTPFFKYDGFELASCSSPEYYTSNRRVYTWGDSPECDSYNIDVHFRDWLSIQKLFAAWNCLQLGHSTKKMYFVCPECDKVTEVVMPWEQIQGMDTCFVNCEDCGDTPQVSIVEIDINVVEPLSGATEYRCFTNANSGFSVVDFYHGLRKNEVIRDICARCGTIASDRLLSRRNGDNLTETCSTCKPMFKVCGVCNREDLRSKFVKVDGVDYCSRHFKRAPCDACYTHTMCIEKRVEIQDDYHNSTTWINVCTPCRSTDISALFEREYSYSFKDACVKGLHTWKGKPIDVDLTKSTIPFLGMEIEQVQGSTSKVAREVSKGEIRWFPAINRAIAAINDAFTSVFNKRISLCKHDGTIPCGTEIVTNPLSIEAWKQVYKSGALTTVFSYAALDETDKQVIGGHIHLSRAACTKGQIYKMARFLHENEKFLSLIAGRKISSSAQWCKSKLANTPIYMIKAANYTSPDRYVAFNMTKHTIEHRYFATPTSPEEVMRNIEFVHALWAGTRTGYINSVVEFFSFVEKEQKQYPILHTWCKSHKRKTFGKNDMTIADTRKDIPIERLRSVSPRCADDDDDECDCCNTCGSCGRRNSEVRWCEDIEEYSCEECGISYCDACDCTVSETQTVNRSQVCPYCVEHDDNITYCGRCNTVVWLDDTTFVEDNYTYCSCCTNEYTMFCDDCFTYWRLDNLCEHLAEAEEDEEEEGCDGTCACVTPCGNCPSALAA